jgi:hypothetical protein
VDLREPIQINHWWIRVLQEHQIHSMPDVDIRQSILDTLHHLVEGRPGNNVVKAICQKLVHAVIVGIFIQDDNHVEYDFS